MKMNAIARSLGVVLLGLSLTSNQNTFGQSLDKLSDAQLATFLDQLNATPQLSPSSVPKTGNFYSLGHPEWPPLPSNPGDSVWKISGTIDSYILNDVGIEFTASTTPMGAMSAMNKTTSSSTSSGVSLPPGINLGGGGASPADSPQPPPDISNYAKFAAQSVLVLDTNVVVTSETNLYNVCAAFTDTNTWPTLQIAPYQNNCLIVKASHFDYSSETRDFCLVVGDKLETPLFKQMDISNPSNNVQNGGWLVQGSIQPGYVTDPMYLLVTNISMDYNAFFRVIPYSGPYVQLSGPNPYDVVSNTISLQTSIVDLSGVTNESFQLTVDGSAAQYSISTNNTITLRTDYNPNGICTIYANVANAARIYDASNPPDNAKIFFSSYDSLPVDFENATYMAWAGNNTSITLGSTYSLFVVDEARNISATISNPSNGNIVASFSGYVPSSATIEIPWNFTEADGVAPYSNDTYVVTFTAFESDTISVTNSIERLGVRTAAANISTYEEEDTSSGGSPDPAFLNNTANTYVGAQTFGLYESLYDDDWLSSTFYYTYQIGEYRDLPTPPTWPCVLTHGSESAWGSQISKTLEDTNYSDFTYYMGHCNGVELGGGPKGSTWVMTYFPSTELKQAVFAQSTGPNHRMRKVAIWGCYSYAPDLTEVPGAVGISFANAFGIRSTADQASGWMMKNVGLFFGGGLPQAGYGGTFNGTQVEAAVIFDDLWVAGPNPDSGSCDPTYAFGWALVQTRAMNPQLDNPQAPTFPKIIGFTYLNFAGVYDSEFVTNNISDVKTK